MTMFPRRSVPERSASRTPGTIEVTWRLEFRDPSLEGAFQQYTHTMHKAADLCMVAVNILLVITVVIQHDHTTDDIPQVKLLCILTVAQCIGLLWLLNAAPRTYAQWRGAVISTTRLYRLALWLIYLHHQAPTSIQWESVSLRLFLLSPAGSNLWFCLFYPLPLCTHLIVQGLTVLASIWRGDALTSHLLKLDGLPAQAQPAFERLSRLSRYAMWPGMHDKPAMLVVQLLLVVQYNTTKRCTHPTQQLWTTPL